MQQALRVGFIGCGRHATKMLYPCLRLAGMRLAAVCDVDEAKAQRNARWFGAEQVYTDHLKMLDTEALDAVLICTGPKTHAPLAMAVLERGLPVFIEKPPALTVAEAKALQARSAETGIPIMVGLMKPHALIYRKLKAIIDAQTFGAVTAVQARMAVGGKNGNGFALLLDMGIHYIALLRSLLGEFAEVSWQKHETTDHHVSYALLLRFASGAIGTLSLSDQHHWMRSNERIEISGSEQFVIADNLIHLTHYQPNGQILTWEPGFSIPNDENNSAFISGYAGEMQAFAQSVRQGEAASPNIADACAVMQLIQQIEPDEVYWKGPQSFAHWQAENAWLEQGV